MSLNSAYDKSAPGVLGYTMPETPKKKLRQRMSEVYYHRQFSRGETALLGSFAASVALVTVLSGIPTPSEEIAQRHAEAAADRRTTSRNVNPVVCEQLPYLTIAHMAKNDRGQSEPVYMNASDCKVPVNNSSLLSTRSTIGYIDPRDQFSITCAIPPERSARPGPEESQARVSVFGTPALAGVIILSQEAVTDIRTGAHLIEACPRSS